MNCPDCDRPVQGRACTCGWVQPMQLEQGRTYRGIPFCSWMTAGRLCNMLANDGTHCNWHQEWGRICEHAPERADRPVSEYQALQSWLELFRPGGAYGHNPGQWWAPIAELVDALHGLAAAPVRTDKRKYEMEREHREMFTFEKQMKQPAAE